MTWRIEIIKDEKILQRVVPVQSKEGRGYEILEGLFKGFYPVDQPGQIANYIEYRLANRINLPEEFYGAKVTAVNEDFKDWLNENATII